MILAGSGRDCEISCRIEVDAWMQVDAPYNDGWMRQMGGDAWSSGSVGCRKRAFPLTSRERFPSGSTVGGDLGERHIAQRFPVFC